MGVRITERSEAVIVFLTRSIPQRQFDVFAINFNIGDVVLEYGGNVNLKAAR